MGNSYLLWKVAYGDVTGRFTCSSSSSSSTGALGQLD